MRLDSSAPRCGSLRSSSCTHALLLFYQQLQEHNNSIHNYGKNSLEKPSSFQLRRCLQGRFPYYRRLRDEVLNSCTRTLTPLYLSDTNQNRWILHFVLVQGFAVMSGLIIINIEFPAGAIQFHASTSKLTVFLTMSLNLTYPGLAQQSLVNI